MLDVRRLRLLREVKVRGTLGGSGLRTEPEPVVSIPAAGPP